MFSGSNPNLQMDVDSGVQFSSGSGDVTRCSRAVPGVVPIVETGILNDQSTVEVDILNDQATTENFTHQELNYRSDGVESQVGVEHESTDNVENEPLGNVESEPVASPHTDNMSLTSQACVLILQLIMVHPLLFSLLHLRQISLVIITP
ncbi:hypothetical protein V6N11_049428 [Hibiscus sabdariffa]|uniref:Uncharacterized protein n=2 Tax=Hibiscus sabdariffa TaxID=183260 RepID=A0ABR2NA77_9ROSI